MNGGRCTGTCGKVTQGRLPAGVPRSQIGPRSLVRVGTLGMCWHLTQGKVRDLIDYLPASSSCAPTKRPDCPTKPDAAINGLTPHQTASITSIPVTYLDDLSRRPEHVRRHVLVNPLLRVSGWGGGQTSRATGALKNSRTQSQVLSNPKNKSR